MAVEETVGENCAPNLICPLRLLRLAVLFAKAKKAHPSQILSVFLSSHSEQGRTHTMFLETWLSQLLEVVCGASVVTMGYAASRYVTGGGAPPPPTAAELETVTAALKLERDPGRRLRGVESIPPPFAINDSDVDLDFSGQGKLETVAATTGEGEDGVGGCTFHSLIEVTPPTV